MRLGRIVDRDSGRSRRRKAVVAHYVVTCVAFVAWWSGTASIGGRDLFWPLALVFLLAALASILVFVAIKNSTQRVAEQWEDDALDERQRWVRDGAYRVGYRVLAVAFVGGLTYLQFALLGNLPLPDPERASILLPFGLWLVTTLPTTILAWTEPDPELEDEMPSGAEQTRTQRTSP